MNGLRCYVGSLLLLSAACAIHGAKIDDTSTLESLGFKTKEDALYAKY